MTNDSARREIYIPFPRDHAAFGQESRPLHGKVLFSEHGQRNRILNQSDLSDLTLRMRRVTGSL